MSQALYERLTTQLELYQKLEEAESYRHAGYKGRTHAEVMKSLKSRLP
jgi:hypothetical protein